MPWYRLAFRPAVIADLAALDKVFAQRLLDKTKWLASNVENLRHEPLAPDLPGLAKYAVGDWRIFYPPSQRATGVNPWLNARWVTLRSLGVGGYASAGCAEVKWGATAVKPWGLHAIDRNDQILDVHGIIHRKELA